MMDKMTDFLARAAEELGLAIATPFRCALGDGTDIVAVAHLPELGGEKGTLVFRTNQFDRNAFGVLQSRGFACSSFGDPLEAEQFELEVYREMFSDWGWASRSKEPPSWLTAEGSGKH